MPAGSIVVIAGIVSAFVLFATVLAWADRYSRKPRSRMSPAKPSAPHDTSDRLAA